MGEIKGEKDETRGGPKLNEIVGVGYRDILGDQSSKDQTASKEVIAQGPETPPLQTDGKSKEPEIIDLSKSPYPKPVQLDLLYPSKKDAVAENPVLEAWRRSGPGMVDGNAFIYNAYRSSSDAQRDVDFELRAMPKADRERWRDFQIQLSEAENPVQADLIRRQRDEAFPGIAQRLADVQTFFEAGRHAEADTKLLEAFPFVKDTAHFKNFLKNADLKIKESLTQMMDKPPTDGLELFGAKQNRKNFFDTDSARSSLYYNKGASNQSEFPASKLLFQPPKTVDDTSSRDLQLLSPEEYAQKLAFTIQSAQDLFASRKTPLFPQFERTRKSEPLRFFDNLVREDEFVRRIALARNPEKVAIDKRLNEINKPGHREQLALKVERVEDRLQAAFNNKDSSKLIDMKQFKETLMEMRDSRRANIDDKLEFVNALTRLTDPKIEGFVPMKDRNVLAAQMVEQFVNRISIDQGGFGTCAMGGIEKLLYGHGVGTLSRMITDVALTGKTANYKGREVAIDRDSLVSGSDVRRMVPPTDGVRSLASQYFALIAGNYRFQLHNDANKTHWRYAHEDGRDIVKDDSTNPPGNVFMSTEKEGDYLTVAPGQRQPVNYVPMDSPHIIGLGILLDTYETITGQSAVGLAIEVKGPHSGDPRAITVSSAGEMKEQLAKRGMSGFPILIHQPRHIATIDGYSTETGLADYDNQWGDVNDRIGKNGIPPEDVFSIAQGIYTFAQKNGNSLASDDLETTRDPNLANDPPRDLEARLAQIINDDTKITEACALAQELKLRADQELSSAERFESQSRVLSVQDFLRKGSSLPNMDADKEGDRMRVHICVSRYFGSLSNQIETRLVLARLLERADRKGDAQKNYLQATKLADDLPLDLIEEQRRLLALDASKSTETSTIAWLEAEEKKLGDPKEIPGKDGLAYQQLNARMELLDFYSGKSKGIVLKPERAAQIATEIRDKYLKLTGFDLFSLPEEPPSVVPADCDATRKVGSAPPVEAKKPAPAAPPLNPDPKLHESRRLLVNRLREAKRAGETLSIEAIRKRLKEDPDNAVLKATLKKIEEPIENKISV